MKNLSQVEFSTESPFLQAILQNGFEGILPTMALLLNEAMKIERSNYLGAQPHQRTSEREGYANGYKPRTIKSRMGELELQIPQTRNSGFYPSSLEFGMRSERALTVAMMEMYIQGVSTRKINAVLEKLCNLEVSPSQVSRVCKAIDEELNLWRNRPIGAINFLLVDARYEKVRVDNAVRDCAVLIAYGIDDNGKRSVLDVSVELSEAQIHWRNFLEGLVRRGLHGLKLITSDNHVGLKQARKSVFPSVAWQRCQFHLQQNASNHVPKKAMQQEVHDKIKAIFNAPDKAEAERLLKAAECYYAEKSPELADWIAENVPESLTVFDIADLTESQRKKLRTTNMVEFQNKELKKRTSCVKVFPNKESLLRLVGAMLMELDDKWQGEEKSYIKLKPGS